MKIKLTKDTEKYRAALQELFSDEFQAGRNLLLAAATDSAEDKQETSVESSDGEMISVSFRLEDGDRIGISFKAGQAVITAGRKAYLFRGMMTLLGELEERGRAGTAFLHDGSFYIEETADFDTNGTMIDCSRNSVLTVAAVKRLIRLQAALGMNVMMLYTEDTYEVPEYPYFGAFRGRYSREELKECDDYADLFGIELIPCIQALAHLKTALAWKAMEPLRDNEDILLVGDEAVNHFVFCCIKSVASVFRSRKIHLGMDEAYSLGLGNYLCKNGYHTKAEIMTRHLNTVMEMCREQGLEVMIWSDMYFRMNSPKSEYYDVPLESDLSNAVKSPEGVTLVYWDYFHMEQNYYEQYIRMHKQLSDRVLFAGGGWTWNGVAPNYTMAYETTDAALSACRKWKVRDVICTFWQDDGAETPILAGLPSMIYFAEYGFGGKPSKERMKKQFEFLTGGRYEDYMLLDELNHAPGSRLDNNPAKYLLYQDSMLGKFDRQIEGLGLKEYYEKTEQKLAGAVERAEQTSGAGKDSMISEMLKLYEALAAVLSVKAELGLEITGAYRAKDAETLREIKEKKIPQCLAALKRYREYRYLLWSRESKIFGWEVIDIRLGGVKARLQSAADRIGAYLAGEVKELPELEEDRLYFLPPEEGQEAGKLCSCSWWKQMVSACNI